MKERGGEKERQREIERVGGRERVHLILSFFPYIVNFMNFFFFFESGILLLR
jgi:hypothetical protein